MAGVRDTFKFAAMHGVRRKLLIVEGVSNSGKTTLCRRLNKDYGFVVIDEGIRFLEKEMGCSRETFMSPPKSERAERMNQKKLYHAESLKLRAAHDALEKGSRVVLDKSALAIMASAYAFEKSESEVGDLPYAIEMFGELVKEWGTVFADVNIIVALLCTDAAVRSDRNRRRTMRLDAVWVDGSIAANQELFLKSLICLPCIQGRIFDGSDSELARRIRDFYEE